MGKVVFSASVSCDGDGSMYVCLWLLSRVSVLTIESDLPLSVADVVRFARSKGWSVTQLSGSRSWRFRCPSCRVVSRTK